MREILFRGKRTDNNEWVYGSPIFQDNYVLIRFWNSEEFEYEEHLVAPETVGQDTGLTDKNDTKIFEGDIIKRMWDGSLSIYQVVFDKYLAAFIGETKPYGMFTTFDGDGEWFEVIGNVHDNSDLISN